MLQLQIADSSISSGSVAVSWCLDHEVLKELAEKGLQDPQVVIVVAPTKNYHLSKESRRVVPLKDLMTYIECKAVGNNKIYGLISFRKPKEARERYLAKDDGVYRNNVLDYDGEAYSSGLLDQEDEDDRLNGTYKFLSQPLEIEVPDGVFAPEPPEWEKPWVNMFFRSKVVDQCNYRRRRLFAYLVQPWIIGFNLLARTVILLFGLLTGARNWSPKYLNPITYGLKDTFDIWEDGVIFIRHQPEDDKPEEELKIVTLSYAVRSFWPILFMPLFLIPIGFFLWRHHPVVAGLVAFIPLLVILSICLISYLVANGNGGRILRKGWEGFKGLFVSDELWYMQQEDIQLITCNAKKGPLTYKNLPSRRKTVRLRFQNLKTKVCKPFSV